MNKLIIKGNLICKDILQGGGGKIITFADLKDFSTEDSTILEGDVRIDGTIKVYGLIIVTGGLSMED